jgi:hypothetical protein
VEILMNPGGRNDGFEGHPGVSARTHLLRILLAASVLAGCGGIDSPDLGKGQVTGRLTGVAPGASAFVYALGHPETKVPVGSDGTYSIAGVPVDTTQVVVFDGNHGIDVVPVQIKGASRSSAADRDTRDLKVASEILAAAQPAGGVSPANAQYEVEGVALAQEARGDHATLFPIPPGKFKVRAVADGLRDIPVDVDVAEAATLQVQVGMDVDDSDARKGCIANGCSGDLKCNGDSSGKGDGRCYQCTDTTQCAAGSKCDNNVCVSESGDLRGVCLPCTQDNECGPGPAGAATQGGKCVVMPGGGGSVCRHGCASDLDCPSGLACDPTGKCMAGNGCSAVLQAFGQTCLSNDGCSAALADAKCVGLVKNQGSVVTPGYCSSHCLSNADCPVSLGYTCDVGNGWCVRP